MTHPCGTLQDVGRRDLNRGNGRPPRSAPTRRRSSFILHLLRSDQSLRTSFPKALSEGPEGAFCQWLCALKTLTRYGLPATAQMTIRKAFERRLSSRIRQAYEMTHDLQRSYLLPYIPAGRARFFRWLIAEGREQYGFSNPEIWWFLIECEEDHSRELIRLYKVSTWWQRFFPDALTPVGWQPRKLARVSLCHHCAQSGLSRSFRPRAHRGTPSGLRMPGRLEAAIPRGATGSRRGP